MKIIYTVIALLFVLPVAADLASDPYEFTLPQRQSKRIPELEVTLHLGDISGGQVNVSVGKKTVNDILGGVPVRQGEVASFTVNGKTYYIKIKRLHNALIGEDLAEIIISSSHPNKPTKPKKSEKKKIPI